MREKKTFTFIAMVFISILLFGVSESRLSNQNQLIEQLDQAIPELLNKYKTTGLAIGLIHDGEVIWIKGYGFADKDKGIEITPSTVFQTASISKPVTAWAIMKLVESGKLDLDVPVENYLTRWQLPPSEFNSSDVTIRRLLSHTAGLSVGGFRGYHPNNQIPSLEESLSGKNSSNNTMVRIIKKPGYEFDYSGGGYTLLSLLVEEVTGEKFEDYIQREILQPLGMLRSSYLWTDALKQNTAVAYNRMGESLPNYLFSAKGAASLYSSVSDLANFVAASLPNANGELAGRNILSPETVKLMYTPVAPTVGNITLFIDSVGLGYFQDKTKIVSHTGSNRGWRNIIAFSPETADGIVILTNSDNGRNVYVEILQQWSYEIVGEVPKMCFFFNMVYYVSLIIAILLFLSLLLYIISNIKNKTIKRRSIFWKIRNKPLWKWGFGILFHIILPILFAYLWLVAIHPLLQDLSPLTSPWVLYGVLCWCFITIVTGIFPKQNSIKIF